MALVHVLANQKGGVGKTTLAVNLGAVVHDVLAGDPEQSPVSVISTDPQASAEGWAKRVKDLPFVFKQVATVEEVHRAAVDPQYRHIFVDTPGSLENGGILQAVLDIADDVIVPLPPAPLAFDPTARTIEQVVAPRGLPYRVVINDWDPRDGEAYRDETREYATLRGWPTAKVCVRHYKIHTRAVADGLVVTQYKPSKTASLAREDFYRLALELGFGGTIEPTVPVAKAVG